MPKIPCVTVESGPAGIDPGAMEMAIAEALEIARERGTSEGVADASGEHLVTVWPDGRVDATWQGSRFVSTTQTLECARAPELGARW